MFCKQDIGEIPILLWKYGLRNIVLAPFGWTTFSKKSV